MTIPSNMGSEAVISRRNILLAVPAVGTLASAGPSALARESAPPRPAGRSMSPPVIEIPGGRIRGVQSDGHLAFRGIPYAAAPTGARRFLPPQPPEPWAGIRDASRFGPSAPQPAFPSAMTIDQARHLPMFDYLPRYGVPFLAPDQSEDCLVLNVWTPAADDRKRPVMVRVHGGGFMIGGSDWAWYDGANIARRGDVVVVTMNHRLNCLGYLHLEDIGKGHYAGSGNAGMLDLVQALRWVRDNIATFGGDPDCVTIFGESGGGAKVATLLAMPAASGLFHRAIIESAGGVFQTRAEADQVARKMLAKLEIGPASLDRLAAVPLPKLYDAMTAAALGFNSFGPVTDTAVLKAAPEEELRKGASADIPLIIGSNLQEMVLLSEPNVPALIAMDEATLRQKVDELAPGKATMVIDHYRRELPGLSPGALFFAIASGAGRFRKAARTLAEAKARGGTAPVYKYLLAWQSKGNQGRALASHGIEVPLTMDNVQTSGSWVADDPDAQTLAEQMSESWIAFARTGDPSTRLLSGWVPFTAGGRATMLFDISSKMVADPFAEAVLWADEDPSDRI